MSTGHLRAVVAAMRAEDNAYTTYAEVYFHIGRTLDAERYRALALQAREHADAVERAMQADGGGEDNVH